MGGSPLEREYQGRRDEDLGRALGGRNSEGVKGE